MKTVLSKATKADIHTDPFPYVVIKNALDEDLCSQLEKEYPDNEIILAGAPPGDNKRFSLSAPFVDNNPKISKVWKDFINLHSSPFFLNLFLNLFKDHIRVGYPHFQREGLISGVRNIDNFSDKNILLDAQICINTPVIAQPSSVKTAHIDNTNKLYAGLFYLRDDSDDSQGGDLVIYKPKSNYYKIYGPRLIEERYTERVSVIPYQKNTLVLFLNTHKSIHGVTARSQTKHTRRFVNFLAETECPLFDLEQHRENVLDKIGRRIRT